MRPLRALALALGFAFAVYGVVYISGFNSLTWPIVFYSYLVLALIISVSASGVDRNDINNFKSRLLYVSDIEGKVVKNILTGEKYRINDWEKIQ